MPQQTSLVFLQYLTSVFDNVSDAILLVGIEEKGFRLLMANATFYSSTGHSEKSIDKYVEDIVPQHVYKILSRQYRRAIRTKQIVEFTYQGDVPRGKLSYKVKIIPIVNTVGEPVQLAIVSHEVTELLRLSEEVDYLRSELQHIARITD